MSNYKFKINGNDYEVAINSIEGNIADVNVNGANYKVEIENAPASKPSVATTPVTASAQTQAAQTQAAPATQPAAPAQATAKATGEGKRISSPLPGVIIDVKVKVGDAVKAGQPVAVIEAMKMENDIEAETDGTVTAVHVSKGDSVLEGAPIVTINN